MEEIFGASVNRMRHLHAAGPDIEGRDELLAMLDADRADPPPDRPWVTTNMVMSLDGAYSVSLTPIGTSGQEAMADDPLVAACVDDMEERTGRTLPYDLDVEISNIGSALSACSIAAVLEAGLTNAGPDLTNESFQAGLEAIGEIDLPGRPTAYLGPGDLSAASGFTTVRFDAANEVWVPVD